MSELTEQLRKKLNNKGIHSLRQLGRAVGVFRPTDKKKDELVDDILAIAKYQIDPIAKPTRGAPPKSAEFDESLLKEIEHCRSVYAKAKEEGQSEPWSVETNAVDDTPDEKMFSGVLDCANKFWFLRTSNLEINTEEDIVIPTSFVNRLNLKIGDRLKCCATKKTDGSGYGLTAVSSVNGNMPTYERKANFDVLVPCYADKQFKLSHEGCSLTERVVDMFAPLGAGQRALIVSPAHSGKTTLITKIAKAIERNYYGVKVIVLLIDERPEDVTDIRRTLDGIEVFSSTFDKGEFNHVHTATLAIEYAKRQVECGRDVVVLMDSLTRLAKAFCALNGADKTGATLDVSAMVEAKRLFGSARNIEDGGSLTIVATADVGKNGIDNAICDEFMASCNMQIVLSSELAQKRVYPAIDILNSGARKQELLLTEEEICASSLARQALASGMPVEKLYNVISQTHDNKQFCSDAKNLLK